MAVIRFLFNLILSLLALAFAAACLVAGAVVYFNSAPAAAAHSTPTISVEGAEALVEVRPGESALSVGLRLEEAGLIRSRNFWSLLAHADRFLSTDSYLKAGTYLLALPATALAIRAQLKEGRSTLVKVTVPEGVTLRKTAALLEEAGVCEADAFLAASCEQAILDRYRVPGQTMEGYLYPDTYLFAPRYAAEKVVTTMADTFFKRLSELGIDAQEMTAQALNDKVILASIVEREYRVEEEAPLMAGVFQNRLARGMALESCATVEYVLTEIEGRPHPERLFTSDTRIENPYNTYRRRGLPPGPISAPGEVALRAAFFPTPSAYLFFRVVDAESGRHYFSASFDDHIRAGELLVKRR